MSPRVSGRSEEPAALVIEFEADTAAFESQLLRAEIETDRTVDVVNAAGEVLYTVPAGEIRTEARFSLEEVAEIFDLEAEEIGPAYTHTISTEPNMSAGRLTVADLERFRDELEAAYAPIRDAFEELGRMARVYFDRHPEVLDNLREAAIPMPSAPSFGPTISPELLGIDDDVMPVDLEACWRCDARIPRDDELGLCGRCREELRAL